jgi:hypothetical protein
VPLQTPTQRHVLRFADASELRSSDLTPDVSRLKKKKLYLIRQREQMYAVEGWMVGGQEILFYWVLVL